MSKYYFFPTPLNAHCSMQHDTGGWKVIAAADHHPDNGAACQSIDVPLGTTPDGNGATLTIAGDGVQVPPQHGVLWNRKTRWTFETDVFGAVADPTAPHPESGPLRTSGINFIDAQGRPWFLHGYAVHVMPALIHQGKDVGPIMDEAKAYGANTLVPICTHLSTWKIDHGYALNPLQDLGRWQGTLGVLFDMAAARGLRVAPAILADCQGLSVADQQRIVAAAVDVERDRWNVLHRTGNEAPANGWSPNDFGPPNVGTVLASRGSMGVNVPPANGYWQWAEWEGRRDLNQVYKAMDDAGAGVLELQHGYENAEQGKVGPFPIPVVQIEPPVFNDTPTDAAGDTGRWTDPLLALGLGLNAGANCAGIVFTASEAMECRPLQPVTAESARQMFRGAQAAFLR